MSAPYPPVTCIYWEIYSRSGLGDDDPATEQQPVIDSLQRLAGKTEIFFIAGNRDFLLGQAFAAKVGFTLLDEPQVLRLGAERVVLIHGDTLCTDDHDYQDFRSLVRTAAWKTEFLGSNTCRAPADCGAVTQRQRRCHGAETFGNNGRKPAGSSRLFSTK